MTFENNTFKHLREVHMHLQKLNLNLSYIGLSKSFLTTQTVFEKPLRPTTAEMKHGFTPDKIF